MQVDFKDTGWKIPLIKAVKTATKNALVESAKLVQKDAKKNCTKDSGELADSIDREVNDDNAIVYSDKDYAKFVEFGTWKMNQQPFLRPALDHNITNIKNIFKKHIKKNLK